MFITIALCTWNRQRLLKKTLQSLSELQIPADVTWEVLVVNNNCSDQTDEVIQQFASRLPIRRLFEPQQGKSYALNNAVQATRGELILWTDDDIQHDRLWLSNYAEAAKKHPEAAFFGGKITPKFEQQPAKWLADAYPRISSVFGALDFGDESCELDFEHLPNGGNMAVRTKYQQKLSYDVRISRNKFEMLSGEETVLCQRMLENGWQGRWVPGAMVQHLIPPQRATLGHVKRYYYGLGKTQQILQYDQQCDHRNRFSSRASLLLCAIKYKVKSILRRSLMKPDRWVVDITKANYWMGRFAAKPLAINTVDHKENQRKPLKDALKDALKDSRQDRNHLPLLQASQLNPQNTHANIA